MMKGVLFCITVFWLARAGSVRLARQANETTVPVVVTCPGNTHPRDTLTIGRYWYECQPDGQLFPRGCLSDEKVRINVGDVYNSSGYAMRCEFAADLNLQIVQSGCYNGPQLVSSGETWQDEKWWYTCLARSNYIVIDVSGCVVNGSRLRLDVDTITKDNQLWNCQRKEDGNIALCVIGCVFQGQTYKIGDEFQDATTVYQCGKIGTTCCPIAVACLDANKQRVQPGATFIRNGAQLQCNIVNGVVTESLQGCAASDGTTKQIGQTWTTGQYTYTCTSQNNTAVITPVSCSYAGPPPRDITFGCVFKINNQLVGCRRTEAGVLSLETFPPERLDLAINYQLKYC